MIQCKDNLFYTYKYNYYNTFIKCISCHFNCLSSESSISYEAFACPHVYVHPLITGTIQFLRLIRPHTVAGSHVQMCMCGFKQAFQGKDWKERHRTFAIKN